jgi:hypothetical protein
MLKQLKDDNYVEIEGILSEVNIEKKPFMKNGVERQSLRGSVTVRVELPGESGKPPFVSEVPVKYFVAELTNDGSPNKIYSQLEKISEYVSIAACGDPAKADRVRISKALLSENAYIGPDDQIRRSNQIKASFIGKVNTMDCKPHASFSTRAVILGKRHETNPDGDMTGRMIIEAGIVQYGGILDLCDFVVENPQAIDFIETNWDIGDTVRMQGVIHFGSEVVNKTSDASEVAFGQPIETVRTLSIKELLITAGSYPDNDNGHSINDVQQALNDRKARINESKNKVAANSGTASQTSNGNKTHFGF